MRLVLKSPLSNQQFRTDPGGDGYTQHHHHLLDRFPAGECLQEPISRRNALQSTSPDSFARLWTGHRLQERDWPRGRTQNRFRYNETRGFFVHLPADIIPLNKICPVHKILRACRKGIQIAKFCSCEDFFPPQRYSRCITAYLQRKVEILLALKIVTFLIYLTCGKVHVGGALVTLRNTSYVV